MTVEGLGAMADALFAALHQGLPLDWRQLPEAPTDPARVTINAGWGNWDPVWPHGLRKGEESWFAAALRFPDCWMGCELAGEIANIFMNGYTPFRMWIDGEEAYAERRPWAGTGPLVDPIVTSIVPGRTYTLLLSITPTELPAPFQPLAISIRPQVVCDALTDVLAIVSELKLAAALATEAAEGELIAQALACLDLEALRAHRWAAFAASGEAMERCLASFADRASKLELHLVGHTHIDMDWKWTWDDTVMCARRDLKATTDLLAERRELRFSMSQIPLYQIARDFDPEVFAQIRGMVASGQWENLAATWVEGDLWMARGESLARQALLAHRWSEAHLGQRATILWAPDTFGHPGNMPQLAKLSGCDSYFHWRGNPGGEEPWPVRWWEGVDGTEILAISSAYGGGLDPGMGMWQALRNLLATVQAGRRVSHHIWGGGDHGGALGRYQLATLARWQERPLMPRLHFSTMADLRAALQAEGAELPRNRGETYHLFEGCFTTHAGHKRYNRACEEALLGAESVAAMAGIDARSRLQRAWEGVMFNQFHDLLDGAAVPDAYADAERRYEAALATAAAVVDEALPPYAGEGLLAIVNSLGFERSELAELTLAPGITSLRVVGSGELLPVQRIGDRCLVWVPHVPAWGSIILEPLTESLATAPLQVAVTPMHVRIETPFASWRISRQAGVIGSCVDKRTGRELVDYGVPKPLAHVPVTRLDLGLNLLELLDEAPNPMSAWHINDILRVERLLRGAVVEIIDTGPVCARIRVRHSVRSSSIEQEIRFYAATPRIDFLTTIDWREPSGPEIGVPQLKAGFNVSLRAARVRHEGPFVVTERPANGMETVAQAWSCVEGDEGGYAVYNDGIYGCDTLGVRHRLTLLRNAYGPDPCSDHGVHRFRYAFEPLVGSTTNGELTRRGGSFNRPLLLRRGAGPALAPPFAVDNPEIVCTSWHRVAEGDDRVLRLFNTAAHDSACTVTGVGPAYLINFLEERIDEAVVAAGQRLHFRPFEVKSLRIALPVDAK